MASALTAQQTSYLQLFEDLEPVERETILNRLQRFQDEVITVTPEDQLVDALAGRSFSRQDRLQLELESLVRYFQKRRELLSQTITAPEVADKLLHTSRQTPHDRVKAQTLLAVKDNGAYRFPLWQFDPQGPDGVLEGLPEVLKVLDVSDFAKLNWLVRPNPVLDGLAPREALKAGQRQRVIREAVGIGAA